MEQVLQLVVFFLRCTSGSNLTLGARYAIHVGDALVKILLMAAILGVWR
jgi:hypothetical protein